MGFLDSAAVFLFNVFVIICTLPGLLVAQVGVWTASCRPFSQNSKRSRVVFTLVCLGWRLLFTMSCWIKIHVHGLSTFRKTLGSSGRPAVVIANHNSFLDTLLLVAFFPVAHVHKVKMFVSSHLFKMPILRTIVTAMRHLAVPFKASAADSTSFELDKDLMAVRQQELEEHVRAGNIAGWFPEGTMNKDDEAQVGMFRAGGFALAAHVDVEIWCVAFRGNKKCWPARSAVGGLPSTIGIDICKLCDSSFDFIRERAKEAPLPDERAQTIMLANAAKDRIQKMVDDLTDVTGSPTSRRAGNSDMREPLLPH